MSKEKEFIANNPTWTSAMLLLMHCKDNQEYSPEKREFYQGLFDHALINAIRVMGKEVKVV